VAYPALLNEASPQAPKTPDNSATSIKHSFTPTTSQPSLFNCYNDHVEAIQR